MQLEYVAKTDKGLKRGHNEDSFGIYSESNLFFVCDGMGGHAAGDYASQKVTSDIIKYMKSDPKSLEKIFLKEQQNVSFWGRLLSSVIMLANRRLFRLAVLYPKLRGMGTTITSVLFDRGFVNVCNVGDSRVYRLRDHELKQLSIDHSWVEELLQDGEIDANELDRFRERNVITRALGTASSVKVDWFGSRVNEKDLYLLCSDGLCAELDDVYIENILNENKDDLSSAASKLIQEANRAGGSDNITIILVKVKGDAPQPSLEIKLDEIVTLSEDNEYSNMLDSFIDKNSPIKNTEVPKGITKDKQPLYKNPLSMAIIFVLVLGIIYIVNSGRSTKIDNFTSNIVQSDILIRTDPPGANIRLYSGKNLLKEKISPADFLSIEEGEYLIEIEKTGYEKNALKVDLSKKRREIIEVNLKPQAKIYFYLGLSPGFALQEQVYLNDELCMYFGQPLTVQRIGIVGKNINVVRGKEYKVRIGDFEKTVNVPFDTDKIKIKVENNNITIE
jgi:protein phosphatase